MSIFRFFTIVAVSARYGLDEILVRALASPGLRKVWLALMAWRPIREPRGKRLRLAMEHLGPLFVKFGQVLSTRQDIFPADIASALASLQDRVPPQPFEQIEQVIEASYGRPWREVFAEIDEQPLGSASVAQVHRATTAAGKSVAIKVLRPQIKQKVERDLALMHTAARLVEFFSRDGERLRPREIVDEFDRCLHEEIDLLHEAASCAQMRRNFATSDILIIPEVHWEYCTAEVMVMELLSGIPVDQIDDLTKAGVDLEKLARSGIEIFFTQVFRDSFFHADMHPGNLHIDPQGRFLALDYGITGTLSDLDKEYIGANFLAFFNRDYRRVAVMHVEAGWTPPDTNIPQFESAIRAVCEPVFARPLKDISFGRLLLQLFQVARRFNLIVQPQLVLLQKTLLNVEGMGRELAPELNLWDTAKPFLEQWSADQRNPKRIAKALSVNAPTMMALLPELPQALRLVLRNLQQNDPARQARMRGLESKLHRSRIVIAVLAGALLATLLL